MGIVDRETWNTVQERITQERKNLEGGVFVQRDQHPLYGKLFCALCGSPYKRRTFRDGNGKSYKSWNCRNRQNRKGCKNRGVREEWLLGEVGDLGDVERIDVYGDRLDVKRK